MNDAKKALLYNSFAFICGVWFVLTSWIWGYLANLIMSYPIGVVGFILWYRGRRLNRASNLNRVTLGLFIVGVVASIAAFFIYK